MIDIIPIGEAEPAAIEQLLDEAFGTDRHGRTAYKLRAGVDAIADLSFVAMEDGMVVGSIQSWPVQLTEASGATTPLILVGPIAVRPDRQRDGIGRMLTDSMLAMADDIHSDPLVLIGDPEYYERFFGFTADATGEWGIPGPVERRRLLARNTAGKALPRVAALGPRVATPLVQDAD